MAGGCCRWSTLESRIRPRSLCLVFGKLAPSRMSVLYRILSDTVPVAWQPSWDLLKKGLPYGYGEMRQIDYLTAVLEGRMQLWALIEQDKAKCAALTEIVEYPSE